MATLYVTEPGARLEKRYQRLQVVKDDEVLMSVPFAHVSEVVLVGWAGATTPAMLALLDAGVGLSFVQRSGRLRGRLRPAEAGNLPLRRKQFACEQDPAFSLAVSREMLRGKLVNSRVMAMRMLRGSALKTHPDRGKLDARLERILVAQRKLRTVADMDALRGLEGSAARAYFGILRAALRWEGEHRFEKRQRRPPRDPINALLSFGYTMLTDALFSAVEVVGLDPYAGFLHAEKYGRPALALDLVEEFRSVVVDSVVLTMVNRRMLREKDFAFSSGGVFLTRSGLKRFLRQFSRRLRTRIYHPWAKRKLSYRKIFEVQARRLRKVIEGEEARYVPFMVR